MTTTERKTEQTTRTEAPVTSHRHHLGLAAAGAVVIVGLGAGLTALIVGVTGDTDTEAPAPGVPPSVEVPFDASDPNAREGIDRRLYELAEQRQKAGAGS